MFYRVAFRHTKKSNSSLNPWQPQASGSERGGRDDCRRAASRMRECCPQRPHRVLGPARPAVDDWLRIATFIAVTLLQASVLVAAPPLSFKATQPNVAREGYFTLSWDVHPGAAAYRLIAADGQSVYRGPLPKAFVSGLADGSYEYHVHALDARGRVIATTATPAVVEVKHWSLRLAVLLLSCGMAVFLVLVGLIVRGTLRSRSQLTRPWAHRGEPK